MPQAEQPCPMPGQECWHGGHCGQDPGGHRVSCAVAPWGPGGLGAELSLLEDVEGGCANGLLCAESSGGEAVKAAQPCIPTGGWRGSTGSAVLLVLGTERQVLS